HGAPPEQTPPSLRRLDACSRDDVAEVSQGLDGDVLAALLDEVSGVMHLERLGTAADGVAQRPHDGWAEDGILHPDGHEAEAVPLGLPPRGGLTRALGA